MTKREIARLAAEERRNAASSDRAHAKTKLAKFGQTLISRRGEDGKPYGSEGWRHWAGSASPGGIKAPVDNKPRLHTGTCTICGAAWESVSTTRIYCDAHRANRSQRRIAAIRAEMKAQGYKSHHGRFVPADERRKAGRPPGAKNRLEDSLDPLGVRRRSPATTRLISGKSGRRPPDDPLLLA